MGMKWLSYSVTYNSGFLRNIFSRIYIKNYVNKRDVNIYIYKVQLLSLSRSKFHLIWHLDF